MTLKKGDLVEYIQDPRRLGIITQTHVTVTGANVCEVLIVCDKEHPHTVGAVRYLNQDYWRPATSSQNPMPLDSAIRDCQEEYEEALELHKTYGES